MAYAATYATSQRGPVSIRLDKNEDTVIEESMDWAETVSAAVSELRAETKVLAMDWEGWEGEGTDGKTLVIIGQPIVASTKRRES